MAIFLAIAPLVAGAYLLRALLMQRRVHAPVYRATHRNAVTYLGYAGLLVSLLLLVYFLLEQDWPQVFLAAALCLMTCVGILLFRVSIGENGVFLKLQFHPWSNFNRYRWKKQLDRGVWILYLYNNVNFELTRIAVPEDKVSRLDLILQNKVGLDYLERKDH